MIMIMRVVAFAEGDEVSGLGGANKAYVYTVGKEGVKLVDVIDIPDLGEEHRGIRKIAFIASKVGNVDVILVSHMGPHAFEYAVGRGLKVYLSPRTNVDEAISMLLRGELKQVTSVETLRGSRGAYRYK